jgi:putative phosphoesterase
MRLAVLSDIHANLPALEAVLTDIEGRGVDGFILAGDYFGCPYPLETMRLLRSLDAWMIRGNSDMGPLRYQVGDAPSAWYTHRQFAILRWTYRHLDAETLDFLRSLPEQCVVEIPGTAAIRVVHGSPRDPAESIFPRRRPDTLEVALAQIEEPVLVCGHTHRPWTVQQGNRLALNPGAVCGPLDGYVGAQYALLTWTGALWEAELYRVSYDVPVVQAAFEESGVLEEVGAFARTLVRCLGTGRNVTEDFLAYARWLAAEAGVEAAKVIPDAIWEEADATYDWVAAARGELAYIDADTYAPR